MDRQSNKQPDGQLDELIHEREMPNAECRDKRKERRTANKATYKNVHCTISVPFE